MSPQQLTHTELLKIAIERKQYPSRLFKYRPIDENTTKSLTESSFWFAKPSTFNDPLDCNLSLSPKQDINKFKAFLSKIKIPDNDIKRIINNVKANPRILSNKIHEIMRNVLDRRGVFSLSKNKNNILMWSHYSSNHEGIVIEFDVLEDLEFFTLPVNVKYQESYTPLKYYENPEQAVFKTVSTKSQLWSYEEEVRIMKTPGLHPISKTALKSIYFGCKATPDKIQEVRAACAEANYPNISFYQAGIAHGKFDLYFHKCV